MVRDEIKYYAVRRLSSEFTSPYTRSRTWLYLWVGDVTCCLRPNACLVSLKMCEYALVGSSTCMFRSPSITMLFYLPILSTRRYVMSSMNTVLVVSLPGGG